MKNSILSVNIRWLPPVPSVRHLIHLSCPSIIFLAWTYQLRSRSQAKPIIVHQSYYFVRFAPWYPSCERRQALWSVSIACKRRQSTCVGLREHFCPAPTLRSSSDTSLSPRSSWIKSPFPPSKVYSKSDRSQSSGQMVIIYCLKRLPPLLQSFAASSSSSCHQVEKIALPCLRQLAWHQVRRSSRLIRAESYSQPAVAFDFDPLSIS